MSATRDRSSGIAFSNTNVYHLYKKAKPAEKVKRQEKPSDSELLEALKKAASTHAALEQAQKVSKIIHPEDVANLDISKFSPYSLTPPLPQHEEQLPHLRSLHELKSNLVKLQELHSRLRFMLKELEDSVSKKK